MKYLAFPLIALCAITSQLQAQTCLELVHADEFNYTGLPDPDKWGYDVAGPGWVNNEEQNYVGYRQENSRVENGHLIIEARHDNFDGHPYSSARLNSNYKMMFRYGRVEFRAKLPGGRGTWPALWLMPNDIYRYATTCSAQTGWVNGCDAWPNSGEIDVMEYVGYDAGVIHGSAHTKNANFQSGGNFTSHITIENETTEFHTYAIEWTENKIEYFVDDISYGVLNKPNDSWEDWPFDQPFYVIMNIAIGGSWGGAQGIDPNIFPAQMVVDYVRMYEFVDQPSSSPYNDAAQSIPGIIQAENYDEGCGTAVGYMDLSPGNAGNTYRSDNVDIETNGDITNVGWTEAGEELHYTVEVTSTGTYDLTVMSASLEAGGSFSLLVDGNAIVSNHSLPITGGWQAWNPTTIEGITLESGTHILTFIIESEGFNIDYLEFHDLVTGIQKVKDHRLKVFPNPANDQLNLSITQGICKVYNLAGVLIFKSDFNEGMIGISQLNNGYYMLEVNGEFVPFVKR